METSIAPIEVQRVKKEVIGREKFLRLEESSRDLTTIMLSAMENGGVPVESRLKAGVYARQEMMADLVGLGLDGLLKISKERGYRLAIYNPGVAWTGNQWAKREVRDNPQFAQLKESLSKEENVEEMSKSAALDFLGEGDFDLAVTFDPVETRGFVSYLKSDMIARKETIRRVGSDLGEGAIESVSWSNGGYKEFQIHRAAVEAIAKDAPDFLGVFGSASEAEEFVSLYGKYGIDVYIGGAPANQEELATPFKLTSENGIRKMINETGMKLVNWLIKSSSGLPSKYMPEGIRLLGTRVLEMGRGQRVENFLKDGDSLEKLQQKMKELIGKTRFTCLADTSGQVVASDRQFVGDDLRVIYGDKVIMLETHDWKPLPRIDGDSNSFSQRQRPSQHGEIKVYGVIGEMRRIVDEIRKGTFNKARNEQERFVVVDPEAKIYEQKKGTQLRLNPLPKLGSS